MGDHGADVSCTEACAYWSMAKAKGCDFAHFVGPGLDLSIEFCNLLTRRNWRFALCEVE